MWYNALMDDYGYPQGGVDPRNMYRPVRPNNTLATRAAAFAALAVFTVLTGLMPVFFGSLSIMFALLSR